MTPEEIREAADLLVREREALEEHIREAHAVAQELRQAVKDARDEIRQAASTAVKKQLVRQFNRAAELLRVEQ